MWVTKLDRVTARSGLLEIFRRDGKTPAPTRHAGLRHQPKKTGRLVGPFFTSAHCAGIYSMERLGGWSTLHTAAVPWAVAREASIPCGIGPEAVWRDVRIL